MSPTLPTRTTSFRRCILRSRFTGVATAALLLGLAGVACTVQDSDSEPNAESSEPALSVGAGNLTLNMGESVTAQTTVSTTAAARMYTLQYKPTV